MSTYSIFSDVIKCNAVNKVPENYVNNDSIMSALDWFPTIARLAHVNNPFTNPNFTTTYMSKIEGEDVSDVWLGVNKYRSRRNPMFWRTLKGQSDETIRYGPFTLYKGKKEMYDLQQDESEQDINNQWDNPNYANIRDAMLNSITEWESTLPEVHRREDNGDGTPYPFDPSSPAQIVGPPDFVF